MKYGSNYNLTKMRNNLASAIGCLSAMKDVVHIDTTMSLIDDSIEGCSKAIAFMYDYEDIVKHIKAEMSAISSSGEEPSNDVPTLRGVWRGLKLALNFIEGDDEVVTDEENDE